MPEITLPAFGIYELCLLAAAEITALYYKSPAGKKAAEQAAKAAEQAFEKVRESLRKKPGPEPRPAPPLGPDLIPKPDEDCPKKRKKCPVCGQLVLPGQMVSETPAYVPPQCPIPGRKPQDKETILGRPDFVRMKGVRWDGAQVYRGSDDRLYYRDNFHVGNAAQIEVFDKRGKNHLGKVCPNCGAPRGT